uniref:Uncharacterized protein n=1 Tax=Arundo donax TaxID=35708 RepID=A0A0A9HBX3_ARUDO
MPVVTIHRVVSHCETLILRNGWWYYISKQLASTSMKGKVKEWRS